MHSTARMRRAAHRTFGFGAAHDGGARAVLRRERQWRRRRQLGGAAACGVRAAAAAEVGVLHAAGRAVRSGQSHFDTVALHSAIRCSRLSARLGWRVPGGGSAPCGQMQNGAGECVTADPELVHVERARPQLRSASLARDPRCRWRVQRSLASRSRSRPLPTPPWQTNSHSHSHSHSHSRTRSHTAPLHTRSLADLT